VAPAHDAQGHIPKEEFTRLGRKRGSSDGKNEPSESRDSTGLGYRRHKLPLLRLPLSALETLGGFHRMLGRRFKTTNNVFVGNRRQDYNTEPRPKSQRVKGAAFMK